VQWQISGGQYRIFPRTPDDQSLTEPLIVSIDLSEIAFT
jgi:hypothetical protein